MSQPFDHNRLHSLLEEADRFLQGEGRHEYAQAVSTALSILIDEIGRMAEGRRVAKKLREIGEHPPSALVTGEEGVRDRVRQLAYVMEQYVTQAVGPWIGTPLFAKDWPDGALADEPVLVLTKECEEAQREIARLRRDADAYDSRISALLSSEHGLKKDGARRVDAANPLEGQGNAVTLTDAALVITFTWSTFKKAGVVLFLLSGWALFCGSLPDHSGSSFADSMRRVV